jgi:hypothetical protein
MPVYWYIHLYIQSVPKNVLAQYVCESIVHHYQICLEYDGHQFEHRGTRRH